MAPAQYALTICAVVIVAGTLCGFIGRRLYRACSFFAVYLAAVFVGELLILLRPETFYQWSFWQAKETLYAVLKLAMAFELGYRNLGRLPGAKRTAWRLAAATVAGTLVALLLPARAAEYALDAADIQARLTNGTILVLMSIWGAVLWYRVPLHWLHRAILCGLVPYLVIFTLVLGLLVTVGPDFRDLASHTAGLAYDALLIYWLWEVWRFHAASEDRAGVLGRLQPWRRAL
ncbi:MAG TPA: hypothetical protein VN461_18830 [Vicinamibacteria bacterium]|nr:hypothetical protein [Vicinamibacteria bacterium]